MKIIYCIAYLSIIGIASNFIGDNFNRKRFNFNAFPFSPFSFEKNGELYHLFKIKRWKDILPDMSKIRPSLKTKKITRFKSKEEITSLAQETCVAEIIHELLIIAGLPCLFISRDIWGIIVFSVWTVGNIPFVMIQRFNRARFISFLKRLEDKYNENDE